VKSFVTLFFSKNYKNIDFLHVAGHSGGTAAALLWAKIRKIPVLMELVNATSTPYQRIFFFFKITAPEKSKIAFLTANQSKFFQSQFKNKIWIKPNPVDLKKFSYCNLSENKKKSILTIAKFMPRKNQIFLIDVLKHLPDNFDLILAGPAIKQGTFFKRDKAYFNNIISRIEDYNLKDKVKIIQGYVEPDRYMKQANVYVMPAWDEGLGTPMIEAMACGVPVVANEAEYAFQEWVVNDENGFLVSIEDPQAWAKAIMKAANFDKLQRQKISESIKNKAGQEKIFVEYKAIFLDLLKI
jgi:glycosyltransferase involved in cell wall biosynthesis